MNKPTLTEYIQAAAMLVDNCAEQLYALAQCMKSDLSSTVARDQKKMALNACKMARESIDEITSMLKHPKRKNG